MLDNTRIRPSPPTSLGGPPPLLSPLRTGERREGGPAMSRATNALTARPYAGPQDLPAMVELARAAWAVEGLHEYPPGQLCWEVPRMEPDDEVRLWEDGDGRLVG